LGKKKKKEYLKCKLKLFRFVTLLLVNDSKPESNFPTLFEFGVHLQGSSESLFRMVI